MGKYNIGEVWWTFFPFEEIDEVKHRPAIVIDDNTIAVLAMMVTTKQKDNPYCIEIEDWKSAGLPKPSGAIVNRIINIDEQRMDKKIGNLSEKDLLKFMQVITECMAGVFHEFSIVAIKEPSGKYLQVYDNDWKCWLFPYFRYQDQNKEYIDDRISDILQNEVSMQYVCNAVHIKYSERDNVYKQYKHFLYKLSLDQIPDNMQRDSFEIDGRLYSWKSMVELENDSDVIAKNDDVIAFVKTKVK